MKLEPLMTYRADLKEPVEVGDGPFGSRRIFDVIGGTFEGPRLRGSIQASGADWLLVSPDGFGRLDVRCTLETDDGAFIYVHYVGLIEFSASLAAAIAEGREPDFGDAAFFTQPRFETGDPRYAWLNTVFAVAEGRVLPNAVEYRVFQALNDSQ